MRQSMRVLSLVIAASAASTAASAQIPGMPLFTNPRYGSGFRLHADMGQPTGDDSVVGDLRVLQGGVTFALGPVGFGANVGVLKNDAEATQICIQNPTLDCQDKKVTGSVLAQLRVAGGGMSSLSLSVFGGASTDLTAYDAADCTTVPAGQQAACQSYVDARTVKQLTIPVGVAVGMRIPLGVASLNLWGAPRMDITRFANCNGPCPDGDSNFRWAVGADFPIFRIISVRAAFDSGKVGDETISQWGIGASIGIGGMR